ncbi:MAG: hypothetical protein HC848_07595 [Limnobacter sp.]|nr:hypothetical protein [Limnobacter sp.]
MKEFLNTFGLCCIFVVAYTFWTPFVGGVVVSYFVPEAMRSKYLKAPWFQDGDDEMFKTYPFRWYLTLWLSAYTASRWMARRRCIETLRQDSPRHWFVIASVYYWLLFWPPILAFALAAASAGLLELFPQ